MRYFLLIFCLAFTLTVQAKSRNCTKAEKQLANDILLELVNDKEKQQKIIEYHFPLGMPVSKSDQSGEEILYQNGYVMLHDADLATSLWSGYRLTQQDIINAKGKDRVNCFRKDPRLKIGASTTDYKEPIFDQGHLTNDADLKDTLIEQINTYVMSNMSPQHCRFNRGIWLSLEHLTRSWANKYKDIFVTTGALFDNDKDGQRDLDIQAQRMLSVNKKQRVGVPTHYYKVIVRKSQEGGVYSIAFLLEHNNEDQGVKWEDILPSVFPTITTISQIEAMGNIDLFPYIAESALKESVNGDNWDMTLGRNNFSSSCR
ncbi:DNA/RNA non-specific endonuclease [Thalassotalea piscium]|uniref:DNA/RNA endonuclease G (NUC1) n=1 Tax=Thalassotalea piscium TaxID=1230533 RepID=A0A7X0NH03_9GAMM|nr:DNA/RNA non-specific endonuclease [Thalassotalea piscium]MBB6543141.1 DNA/RNA endonuclease G (NUC1) [Thalassotalea piscium]